MEAQKQDVNDSSMDNGGAGLLVLGIISIFLALAMVGLTVPFLISPGIADISALLAAGGSGFATDFQMPYVIFAGCFFAIIGGVVAFVGSAMKSRKIGYVAVVLVLLGGGLTLGPAAYLQSVLDSAFLRLQENPLSANPPFSAKEQSLLDMTSAVFNECCFKVYDASCGTMYAQKDGVECEAPLYNQNIGILLGGSQSDDPRSAANLRDNQLPVLPCSDAACPASQYPPIVGDVGAVITSLEELLCTCYSSQAIYDTYVTAITNLGSCAAFEKVVIPGADSIEIPTTGVTFGKLPALVATTRSALTDAELTTFAMVGKMYPPGTTFDEPAATIGFSCGIGYAKGMAFQMYLGVEQASQISIYGAYACGGIEIVAAVLTAVYWAMGGGREDDGWGVDHYDTQPTGQF